MVRNIKIQRIVTLFASVILLGTFVGGCVADGPRTHLTWFPASDALPHATATLHPVRPAQQTAALGAHSKPAWYTASALPPLSAPHVPATSIYTGVPTFAWPITGPVILDFGAGRNGERNDGINIAAPYGTPIRASAAGTVTYAGNELRGYGNLILIKHDDGYVTAYAHAQRFAVSRGDAVLKGQIIAYSGDSGDVSSPQLHFEIRRGVQPINPRTLLLASRSS